MKIYLDYYGNITKVTDNVFVANASGYDNIIAFYFVDRQGNITSPPSDISYCSLSVKRSDGFVISRLNASYVLDPSVGTRCYRYTIRDDDGILYKRGQLEISAQFVRATIDDSGDTPVITKRETLAVESITAHVKQNIGLAEEDTFNETLEQARLDRDTLQAEITENAQAIDANAYAIEQLEEKKADTVMTAIPTVSTEPVFNADVAFSISYFENDYAVPNDYFTAIVKYGNAFYATRCRVVSKSGSTYNCYYAGVYYLGNPTQTESDISALESDAENNIRNIQWVESGNSYSIKFTKKDNSTVTVSVPLTAIKNELNSLDGRLDTAESDIDTLQSDMTSAESDISAIQGKIPAEATSSNKLADKNFVNSTVATQTANFLATLDAHDDLGLTKPATTNAIVTALNSYAFASKTNNDYCYVINTDGIGNTLYDRFKWKAGTSTFAYEYTLNNSSFTAQQWATINSGLTSADKLPEKVNDRYLHTNASTGALEWVEVQSGGADDYDDLEHIPVVNADLETIVPVENTYYRHAGAGGGGAVATPFVLGQTYDKVYFDTSKSVEEMETILSGLEYEEGRTYILVGYDAGDYPNGAIIIDLAEVGVAESGYAILTSDSRSCLFSTTEIEDLTTEIGWQNLASDGSLSFSSCVAEEVNNVSFASSAPFESQFIDGVIYLYRDGEYQPLYGGRPMRWGTIQGTVTDQQDLVQYLNGFSKTVVIESGQSDVQGIPQLTAQQITTACDEFQAGANVLIKKHNSASYLAVLGAHKISTLLSEIDAILYNGDRRYYLNYLNTNGTVSITANTLDTNAIVTEIGNIETALQTIRGTAE